MRNKSTKVLALAMSLCMTFALTACGSSNEKVIDRNSDAGATKIEAGSEKNAGAEAQKYDGYYFTSKGYDVKVDVDMTEALAALGEPVSYFEAPSCAFEGMDKVYTYSSFEIDTYPEGKTDKISAIILKDDTVSTNEGAYIGMAEADARACYPNVTGDTTSIVAETPAMRLTIIFANDVVASIQYSTLVLDTAN